MIREFLVVMELKDSSSH